MMTMTAVTSHNQLVTMAHLLAQEAYTLPTDSTHVFDTDQELDTIREAALRFYKRLEMAQRHWDGWDENQLQKLRHDLKNDLNLIVGFTHLQLRDKTSPLSPQLRLALEYIYSRGRTLASLVNCLR